MVRGIYATALTKLLLENDFQIVHPSQAIKARFCLQDNSEPPDIKVQDRYDLQGVVALGTVEAIARFHSILHLFFEDALIRKWDVSLDGIYKGRIVKVEEEVAYVELGNKILGVIPREEISEENQSELIVQVEREKIGGKHPVLTTNIKIVGTYAILVHKSRGGVSLKIRDINKRAELYSLGKQFSLQDWGIIWREHATLQPKDSLKKEIVKLVEAVKTFKEKALTAKAPTILVEGLNYLDVEFPFKSKNKLDMLRASVTPTLEGHHFYKSCGGSVSTALEMAERLLEKGQHRNEVEEIFKNQVEPAFPKQGSSVDVEHAKLSGAVFHLGKATIEAIGDEKIQYWRTIETEGFYDGLDVKKEVGDKAVSETRFGEWYVATNYFSVDGRWKGTYINLNTPVEVCPDAIRYVDLEVDVCILPNGETKIIDLERLEDAYMRKILSQTLFEKVKNAAKAFTESDYVRKVLANFI